MILGGLIGALYSHVQWKEIEKRADIVEFRGLESELLAENLLVEKDGKYQLNPPDTTVTLDTYVVDMYKICGYKHNLAKIPLKFGILESGMYKQRENFYLGLSGIGMVLFGASLLRKKK
jgi:hypothetical protein